MVSSHEILRDVVMVSSTYRGFTIIPNYRPALYMLTAKIQCQHKYVYASLIHKVLNGYKNSMRRCKISSY